MHPKVKICGMKNAETIKTAIDHKVDFLGFVFYPDSPRNLTPKQAAKLTKDIPNTVYKAIKSLKDVNPDYLTIHASGGLEMMKAAKKAQSETNKKLKILAVTILTSLTNKDLKQIGSNSSVESQVQKLAQTAKLAKIHGIVCSAHEIKKVRKVSKNFEIVVPGIRLTNKVQDQKRVMSPKQALKLGATHLVIGRDITKGNPKTNIKKVLNALI